MPSAEFINFKTVVEKQIIVVIDFLLLDHQIKPIEVRRIAQFVLEYIDPADTRNGLYSSFSELLNRFPVLSSYLQNTSSYLARYSHA